MTKSERWSFFAVVSLGLLMISLDNSILYTALPVLTTQLGATPTQALWVINAYPLVLSGLLLGAGSLGDMVGHRLMFVIGLCIFGVASLAAAFAPNPELLIAARAVLGAGAAVMMPATLALITLTFPDEQERNTAIGVWASVAVVGAALGPVVGGALLRWFWWGSVFLINVPIVALALVLTVVLAPENMPNPAKQWDWLSSLYALLALTGLTMSIKSPSLAAAATCFVGAALFVLRQRRIPEPLLTFDIFRSRLFAGGVIAAAGSMFVTAGVELMTTQKLQLVDAFSPLHAGLTIIAMAIAAFPASVLGGYFLHRVGFLPLIAGGFAVAAAGTWALAGNFMVLGLVLSGVGVGAVMSVASIAIIGSAPLHRSGMAAGVEEVSYEFGSLVTVAFTGSLLQREVASGATHLEGYQQVLFILALSSLVFGLITWWCFRDNPKTTQNNSQQLS